MPNRHLSSALMLLVPSLCFGWGRDGHQIAAEIASRHLNAKAQACVQSLLPGQSLADVSVWADEIKGARRSTAPWHYADMAPGEKEFDLARDCPKNGCVVSAIQRYCGVLKDEKASPADRTEALKFLVHFVGDVHCPMHVAYAHDKGGNDVAVEFFYNKTNLHRVWDSLLIERQKRNWKTYAADLDARIPAAKFKEWAGCMNACGWATESHKVAVTFAYVIPKDGQLGREYFDQAVPIVDQQLSMAGVRLAALLNGIFENSKVPASSPAAAQLKSSKGIQFVGSRKSGVYHYLGCPVVGSISPQNLTEYAEPPAGKRLHQGCRP
jgi:nuclease S1